MTETLINTVTGAAPFTLLAISVLCVAVMFKNLRTRHHAPAQKRFGHWPDTAQTSSPSPGLSDNAADHIARRVALSLAVGIVAGEALFAVFPGGV